MTNRLRALGRVVAQQRMMRDRALASLSALGERERDLAERARILSEPRNGDGLDDLLLPMIARRLEKLAAERTQCAAEVAACEAAARTHARRARAGEIGLGRLESVSADRRERAFLEEIAARFAGQPRASRLP